MSQATQNKPRQTQQQKRAAHAWKVVESVCQESKKKQEEFSRQAKKMPVRILTSGLGPSLAFLEAKELAPRLTTALNQWIAKCEWAKRAVETDAPNARLSERIRSGDSTFLRMATAECMSYLEWLVRFTEAEITIGKKADNEPTSKE